LKRLRSDVTHCSLRAPHRYQISIKKSDDQNYDILRKKITKKFTKILESFKFTSELLEFVKIIKIVDSALKWVFSSIFESQSRIGEPLKTRKVYHN